VARYLLRHGDSLFHRNDATLSQRLNAVLRGFGLIALWINEAEADRAAAAQRETNDLEKARADDALRHSNLRMQARENDQIETPTPAQSPVLEKTEQEHPNWYREPNSYRPCPNNRCPSPPPQ
jgi:hypothetical protein